jgi:hypothetical protein
VYVAARYWLAQLARAVVAFAAGFFIALNQGHTAGYGIAMFAAFAIVSGLIVAGFWFVTDAGKRSLWVVQGALGIAAGIVTLVVHTGGLGALLYGVSVWGVVARDRMLVGGATLVLAILYMIIPADHTLAVGLFGAYACVIGVYLAIGAFSLKWAKPDAAGTAGARNGAAENTEYHA